MRCGQDAFAADSEGLRRTPGSLFGPMGFVCVFGDQDLQMEAADFGRPWLLDSPGVTIKAYPCCTCAHTALDSLFALMSERKLDPAAVRGIEVDVDEAALGILIMTAHGPRWRASSACPIALPSD
jgi:2-methylcitrate dehydratase PrpD